MQTFSWGILVGGLAFFFFGLYSVREGLQLVAGDRLRGLLRRITGNRLKAFGFGALVTMVLQSSSATTAMLVSFAGAQLLTLSQSFAVILGADIGTTLVVFLIAAKKVTDYALFPVAIGIALYLWSKQKRIRYCGRVLFGFGLLFYGIALMIAAMQPLQGHPWMTDLFTALARYPLWTMIGAALVTALTHSSAATLGIAISLAFSGTLTIEGALPIVLGANIGTTITAIMASLGGDINGRRVAAAHLLTKTVGVVIAMPLLGLAAQGLGVITAHTQHLTLPFASTVALEIAIAHLAFNLGLGLLFIPFLPLGVRLLTYLLPERETARPFGPQYLDPKSLETPSLAFAQVAREVLRIANITHELFEGCMVLFRKGVDFHDTVNAVEEADDKVDILEKGVRFFLAQLSQSQLSEELAGRQLTLLALASDLEEIGDTVSKDLVRLAKKKYQRQQLFSDEGWDELRNFHQRVSELFTLTIGCCTTHDPALATQVEARTETLYALENELRLAHLHRLGEGHQESVETSSIHLDLLGNLRHVASKLTHIAALAVE